MIVYFALNISIQNSNSFAFLLLNVRVASVQVFLYFNYTFLFCSRSFQSHFHIYLGINTHKNLPILLYDSCSCHNDSSSSLSHDRLFISETSCNTPIFITFFKRISHIYKVSRSNNKYLFIGKIDYLCRLINNLSILICIDVDIKRFLELDIILHLLIEGVADWKGKRIDKDIYFFVLALFIENFESIGSFRDFWLWLGINIKDSGKEFHFLPKNAIIRMLFRDECHILWWLILFFLIDDYLLNHFLSFLVFYLYI